MVYEARAGQTFLLGATSWRIEQITRDRVVVTPAPGVPGAVPFWHGEGVGRPRELGEAIGAFARWAVRQDEATLQRDYDLDGAPPPTCSRSCASRRRRPASCPPTGRSSSSASATRSATGGCACSRPTAAACTPRGRWRSRRASATASASRPTRSGRTTGSSSTCPTRTSRRAPSSCSSSRRRPRTWSWPSSAPAPCSARASARTRRARCSSRAPIPGRRTPLWQQRLKAQSLLEVARRYPQFPVILETYRECLRDVLDVPGLTGAAAPARTRASSRIVEVETQTASPFASSLLFDYVATYMYEGDTPAAERRAVALSLDRELLRELLGQEELRDLIDPAALEQVEDDLQHRSEQLRARDADALHDVLRRVGDLTADEAAQRVRAAGRGAAPGWRGSRTSAAPCAPALGGEERWIAAEDAGLYRDALGVVPPGGLPEVFLADVPDAMLQPAAPLRPHARPLRDRRGAGALRRGRRPGARGARAGRRARARRAAPAGHAARVVRPGRAAPPAPGVAGRAAQGDRAGRPGDAGALRARPGRASTATRPPAPASTACATCWRRCRACRWRRSCGRRTCCRAGSAPTRRTGSTSSARTARWSGSAPGRWAGAPGASRCTSATTRRCSARRRRRRRGPAARLHDLLRERLAPRRLLLLRPARRVSRTSAADELREALWDLAWAGEATNDAFAPLRARGAKAPGAARTRPAPVVRALPPPGPRHAAAAGPLVARRGRLPRRAADPEARRRAWAELLLERHGVLTRELVRAEGYPGGFAALYPALSALETLGVARRGYFVEGLGGAQFALPGAVERLRAQEEAPEARARHRHGRPGAALRRAACAGRTPRCGRRRGAPARYLVDRRRPARALSVHAGGRTLRVVGRPDDVQPALEALAAAVRAGRLRRLSAGHHRRRAGRRQPARRAPRRPRLPPRPPRLRAGARRCLRATPSTTRPGASAPCSPGTSPTTSRRRIPRFGRDRWPERLAGRRVEAVDAVGKHLLLRFEGGLVIHSHLRMTGAWRVLQRGERWPRSPRSAWLVLAPRGATRWCSSTAPCSSCMTATRVRTDPRLAGLGPDLVAPSAVRRGQVPAPPARGRPDARRSATRCSTSTSSPASATSGSRRAAGCARRRPVAARSATVTDDEALAVVRAIRPLMQQSAEHGRQSDFRTIYDKAGPPCPRCGAPALIQARGQGDDNRTTYWCPVCQR